MSWMDLSLRLVAALAAGLALGLEREWRGHVAGLRTHVLVAVGAALFTLAGAYGFADLVGDGVYDPARIAAQVASGIGFIGAGAILRDGATIKGLTTAATLWLAASVGVMAGVGNYALLAVGTGVVLVTLVGIPYMKPSRWAAKREIAIRVSCALSAATLPAVLSTLRTTSAEIGDIDVDVDKKRQRRTIVLTAHVPRRFRRELLIQRIAAIPEVRKVSVNYEDDQE